MDILQSGVWSYVITENGVGVCGFSEESENIIIPETIDGKIVETVYFGIVDTETKSIFIPKTVKEFVMWGYLISLKKIIVDEDNQWFSSKDGVLYNKEYTILVRYPCAMTYDNKYLNGVVEIADYAFADVQNIDNVVIPDTITKIGLEAFSSCETLNSIKMTNSVKQIGAGAFCGCSFKDIELTENICEYEMSEYDEGLGFFSGNKFVEFSVPENIKRIGDKTFEYCRELKKIYISSSVEEIGKFVFYECNSLEEIVVSKDNKFYYSEDGVLYSRDGTLLHYPKSKKDTSFIVPDNIIRINTYAFYENKKLKNLTIGKNVFEIGRRAFACSHIESINIPSKVKIIEKDVFLYTSIKELYMPKSIEYIVMDSGTAGNINPFKDMQILVDKGSYAEKMCIEYGLNYKTINN